MPTNLYGTNDNYHPTNSHVLPALIRKICEAKINNDPFIKIWGTGEPKREFLHVDDLADACYFLLKNYNEKGIINIGWSKDISIKELAELIALLVDYKGAFKFDLSKPNGTPKKLLDTTKINHLGWFPKIDLKTGLIKTINEFKERYLL